jgi:hypothetical protein
MPPRTCPTCQDPAVPVLFGMPSPVVIPAVKSGLLELGGCIVRGDEHTTWWCATCQESFEGPNTHRAIGEAIESAGIFTDDV